MLRYIRRWVFAGIIALNVPAISVAGTVEPTLHIEKGAASSPQVALTLDLCMGDIDHRIFDILVSRQIKATLFVTARWLRRNKSAVDVIKAHPDLFEVANHGKNHVPAIDNQPDIYGLKTAGSLEAVCEEVRGGEEGLANAGFPQSKWYRDAAARYSDDAIKLVHAMGYEIGGFSLNADMGASLPAKTVARRISSAKNGDVIIAHMNQPKRASGQGVADGILELEKKGFSFVKLSDAVKPVERQTSVSDCNALQGIKAVDKRAVLQEKNPLQKTNRLDGASTLSGKIDGQ